MDITELRDNTVIELAHRVEKPRAERSRKPPACWEVGTRFHVRQHSDCDRRDPQLYWELGRIRRHRWDVDSRERVNLNLEAELFIRVVRCSRPIEDAATLIACTKSADAADVLDCLVRHGRLTLDDLKQAIAAYEQEQDEADARKEAEKSAAAPEPRATGS
jgi:hypothetical protein